MKKVLLATTVLAGFASAAVADDATKVKISGYGRFGIVNNSAAGAGVSKTQVVNRLRFNIDASTTTDSGVEFGARLRLQNTTGNAGTTGNDALLYTSYEGLRVEVGNTNTAYDSAALLWDSEMGYRDTSFGDPFEYTFYYDSTAGGSKSAISTNYMGVYASYTVGDFTGQISYVNPNQGASKLSNLPQPGTPSPGPYGSSLSAETSIAAQYKFGAISVSAALVQNGAGINGNNPWFIGAAYAINENANVGLNYIDEHMGATAMANQGAVYGTAIDPGKTTTLYGNYKMDAITLKGYVAHNDNPANKTNNAYGIGADYDLGGARLSGSIQRGYGVVGGKTPTVVDLGVRFDF